MKILHFTKVYLWLLAILSALFLASSTIVFANEVVNKTLDVSSDSLIEIKHVSGEAKVIGWDKSEVKVEGELGDKTESFRFERDGKSVIIEVIVEKHGNSWGWNNHGGTGDDLVIHVPHNSRIDYHSPNADMSIEDIFGGSDIDMINGDLTANNLTGRISLQTVNGDIRGTKLAGELTLDAVNGDIKVDHIKGDVIRANTVNGDVKVNSSAKEVRAETVNGDIEFTLGDVNSIKTNTVNGSIEMDMNLIDGGTVRASSVGGDIRFGFQEGVQAKFDLEAHAGGSIKNRITSEEASSAKYGLRKWLEFSTGNPAVKVEASTVNGRIEVKTRN
ncbi:MAG: DUF4097 and DUF4098 domain-containing protein YvlB [Alphaproteobacteria bacterium]|jgi:DUF4097 and DUF4098 domain-containing protein YvlB